MYLSALIRRVSTAFLAAFFCISNFQQAVAQVAGVEEKPQCSSLSTAPERATVDWDIALPMSCIEYRTIDKDLACSLHCSDRSVSGESLPFRQKAREAAEQNRCSEFDHCSEKVTTSSIPGTKPDGFYNSLIAQTPDNASGRCQLNCTCSQPATVEVSCSDKEDEGSIDDADSSDSDCALPATAYCDFIDPRTEFPAHGTSLIDLKLMDDYSVCLERHPNQYLGDMYRFQGDSPMESYFADPDFRGSSQWVHFGYNKFPFGEIRGYSGNTGNTFIGYTRYDTFSENLGYSGDAAYEETTAFTFGCFLTFGPIKFH